MQCMCTSFDAFSVAAVAAYIYNIIMCYLQKVMFPEMWMWMFAGAFSLRYDDI